jgi:hypothetical protein
MGIGTIIDNFLPWKVYVEKSISKEVVNKNKIKLVKQNAERCSYI